MGVGQGGRNLLFSASLNPFFLGSLNFSGSYIFFRSFKKFVKSVSSRFCDCCSGTDCESVIRWWENCSVYNFFCIFIIISSSSSSISFLSIINCLCLNPGVSPFAHFSSHWGDRGGVSERLLPAAGLNHHRYLDKSMNAFIVDSCTHRVKGFDFFWLLIYTFSFKV